MSAAPLKRRSIKDPEQLTLVGDQGLLRGRVHEFCGPARMTAAMLLLRGVEGVVIWVAPAFQRESLHGAGIRAFTDPGRMIFVSPERGADILWTMEEVLRSGAVPLVVAETSEPPPLTPVRRLTLAAETGGALTGKAPTALLLTPGDGGAAGVESRWHMSSRHHGEGRRWHLERRRARLEAPKAWSVNGDGMEFSLDQAQLIG